MNKIEKIKKYLETICELHKQNEKLFKQILDNFKGQERVWLLAYKELCSINER